MTLIIETNGERHVWKTGDPIDELQHAIRCLQEYINDTPKTAVAVATSHQNPLPNPL